MLDQKFGVILIDCPWSYNNYSKAANGAPQYKTMGYTELAELPIAKWAEKDCLLASWCTWPMMSQGIKLLEQWGFDYITGWPWIKTLPKTGDLRCGIGFWSQSVSEALLLGRRGKISPPKTSKHRGLNIGKDRQFYGQINKHSDKPEDVPIWLEKNFKGPYLELFARRNRPNWTTWGLDTGYKLTKDGVELVTNTQNLSS